MVALNSREISTFSRLFQHVVYIWQQHIHRRSKCILLNVVCVYAYNALVFSSLSQSSFVKLCAHINTLELGLHGQFTVVVIFYLKLPNIYIFFFVFYDSPLYKSSNGWRNCHESSDFCFDFVFFFYFHSFAWIFSFLAESEEWECGECNLCALHWLWC